MTIIERGPCKRYNKTASPIKPWGVLLHTTEGGNKAGLDSLFINNVRDDGVTVGVHFAVFKDGTIHSYGPWEPGKAWYMYHAGKSNLFGLSGVSRVFIGIEIEHRLGENYPRKQLDALKWLLATIQDAYRDEPYWRNILTEHSVVAPQRKIDPTYPWKDVKAEIYSAWEEGAMAVQHVSDATLKPELEKLVKAGIITKPEALQFQNAAGVDWTLTLLGRIAERAGLVPK